MPSYSPILHHLDVRVFLICLRLSYELCQWFLRGCFLFGTLVSEGGNVVLEGGVNFVLEGGVHVEVWEVEAVDVEEELVDVLGEEVLVLGVDDDGD